MSQALSAYRTLLRSCHVVFSGDHTMLNRMRSEARKQFELNRQLSDVGQIQRCIADAHDVSTFLRDNLVQLKRDESSGRYGL